MTKKTRSIATFVLLLLTLCSLGGLIRPLKAHASAYSSDDDESPAPRRKHRKSESTSDSGGPNPLFGYTHRVQSPLTMKAGRLAFGTDIAFGLTDFLQVGTSLLQDVYKIFNANGKLALIQYPSFAAAVTVGYQTYNLNNIYAYNPDLTVSSWQPGLTTSFALLDNVALFVAGNLNYNSITLITDSTTSSGYQTGAQAESDISWAYNPPSSRRRISNVLSAGLSYDFTYKLIGYGVSHHWPGFHIGVHYFPNAGEYRVQPIIAGGGAIDF